MPRTMALSSGGDARRLMFDVAVAVAAAAISASIFIPLHKTGTTATGIVVRGETSIVVGLLAVHSLCLIARRVRPLVTLGLNLITGLAVVGLGWPPVVLGIASVVAVYSTGAEVPRRLSLVGLAAAELSVVASGFMAVNTPDFSTKFGNVAILGVTWFIGSTIRSRREYALDLERRNRELEAARDELARQAVAQERLRIARELHDVIAHSMSVIAVQSGAGTQVIDTDPAEAKRALQVIEEMSRSSLTEFRRVLGLLRDQDVAGTLDPVPSLEGLQVLIDQVSGSGLDIELQRFGDPPELSPGLQLTIYRIVQEALTNMRRHANARRGRVVIFYESDSVRIEVVDDGAIRSPVREGNGLRGMRERVAMYGGNLDLGVLPEGGFRVAASLPADSTK